MQKTTKPIGVLVGEGNDGHAQLVATSLRESGIANKLYRGRDGAETMALLHSAWNDCKDVTLAPSLVLLDCGLSRFGGIGVLKALNGDRRCRWIPVIMMSAVYNREQAERCRRLGCDTYITKWTVFLGLPGFVSKIRLLADRTIWIASRRLSTGRSHNCYTGTLDIRSLPDVGQTRHHWHKRIGKEV